MRVVGKLLKHAAASLYMQTKKKKKRGFIYIHIATRFLLRRCCREREREKEKGNADIIYILSGHSVGPWWSLFR